LFFDSHNNQMVAFCDECSQSLPFADLIISDGQEKPAPGYICPHCDNPANNQTSGSGPDGEPDVSLPDELVVKDGEVLQPDE